MLVATQRGEGWLRSVVRAAGSASERGRALELLDFVGIRRLAAEPAGNLSYGQRKLLELASLLVADPAVLLLDEPAGGVNPTLINQLASRIRDLNADGKTFLVVEHNMEFVMSLCDEVTVLSQGRTLISGTPAVVRADPAVLDAYLGDDGAKDERRPEVRVIESATEPGAPPAPLLSISGIVAGYGGGDILKDVSFDVPEGGITCIVGPNGAGKSTLLATISGLLRPRSGEIHLRGEAITGLSPSQILARGVSLVPQAHSLFPQMTVAENVEMGAFTIRARALVAERLATVEELFPIVRERAGEKAGSLSGGQQRLVEFARCLMLDPPARDPRRALDGAGPADARDRLRDGRADARAPGRTILLVEQNARAGLELASSGVVLENGQVRLSGTGREVLEHPEIGALYLGGSVSAHAA